MSTILSTELLQQFLPKRPADAHKGTFGHLFVIAASRGFTGAAKLACIGAYRSGAGLVTAGIPRPLANIMAASLLEAMTLPLNATKAESIASSALEAATDFAANKNAVVLGPGISQHADTRSFVHQFIRKCKVPLLLDADALNCLKGNPEMYLDSGCPKVLTPHPGEMARLTGLTTAEIQKDRQKVALDFAKRNKCTVVLKGANTVIASEAEEVFVNPTGNSGMASGGTGDVLSGIIGGLMAQLLPPLQAAMLGTYLHGLAGDIAAEKMTERAMIAGDLADAIPEAWRILEKGQ